MLATLEVSCCLNKHRAVDKLEKGIPQNYSNTGASIMAGP